MRDLTQEEKEFLERIIKSCSHKRTNGYWYFTFRTKHYRKSRVLLQLYLNKKLEVWEHVHHKDGNNQNDSLENLEVKDSHNHHSDHTIGLRNRKFKSRKISNKLSQEKINKILELSKEIKHYSHIAKIVGVSDFTVAEYIKKIRN